MVDALQCGEKTVEDMSRAVMVLLVYPPSLSAGGVGQCVGLVGGVGEEGHEAGQRS